MHLDTHPGALQRQIELMRDASVSRRFAAVRSLSGTVAALSRRALRRNMHGASECDVDLAFVTLHYGDAVAAMVRRSRADGA